MLIPHCIGMHDNKHHIYIAAGRSPTAMLCPPLHIYGVAGFYFLNIFEIYKFLKIWRSICPALCRAAFSSMMGLGETAGQCCGTGLQ